MVHTHSVVLWKNPADGSTILSQRYADAYAEPQVVESPPRVARVVQPKGLLVSGHSVDISNFSELKGCSLDTAASFCCIRFRDPSGHHPTSTTRFCPTSHLCLLHQSLARELEWESG